MVLSSRRLYHVVVCICMLDVTSLRHVNGSRHQPSPHHSWRWTVAHHDVLYPVQTVDASRTTAQLATQRCNQHSMSCLTDTDPAIAMSVNAAMSSGQTLNHNRQHDNTLTSSRTTQVKHTVQSSNEEQRRRDEDGTWTSNENTFDQRTVPQSRIIYLPAIRGDKINPLTKDSAVLVRRLHPSDRQQPLPTDATFRTISSSIEAVRADDDDADTVKDIDNDKLHQHSSRTPSFSGVLSESAPSRPLARHMEAAVRVRRGMWYVKRPLYYRHNDDSWTRRNWRVNLMRVWGKRHQLRHLTDT